MPKLGVNIDHIATLRELRGTKFPEPVQAAGICELAGADGITVHLREDRRHICDRDVKLLRETIQTKLNLEMAVTEEMVQIASDLHPDTVCFVPERREEITTEGGLNVISNENRIRSAIERLNERGIAVSLFIEPDFHQIEASKKVGAQMIEIHTGKYCAKYMATKSYDQKQELEKILKSIQHAKEHSLICNAGHGLDYQNILPLSKHPDIHEFNIGHSIICRAVLAGLEQAVREMISLIR
jgi:pyridoxine 5-phosphate synthase